MKFELTNLLNAESYRAKAPDATISQIFQCRLVESNDMSSLLQSRRLWCGMDYYGNQYCVSRLLSQLDLTFKFSNPNSCRFEFLDATSTPGLVKFSACDREHRNDKLVAPCPRVYNGLQTMVGLISQCSFSGSKLQSPYNTIATFSF